MRCTVNGVFVVLTLMLSALFWSGCSKQSQPPGKDNVKAQSQPPVMEIVKSGAQPSDEEIIKAIVDSGIMNRADGSLTVVPPVTVVQKGKQDKSGTWPVKVKFTLKYKMKDGRTTPPTETTTSFRIFEAKDNAGKSVWKAQLGT
jgi:hypothetical protein